MVGILLNDTVAPHPNDFVGAGFVAHSYPSVITHNLVFDPDMFSILIVNDQSTVQVQTLNDYSRSTNEQSGSGTDIHRGWAGEFLLDFSRTASKVRLQNNGGTRIHPNSEETFFFGRFDIATDRSQNLSKCSILEFNKL